MRQYLITGRDQDDRETTECVCAKSAQAALEALQARGWRDLILHTDDYSAKIIKQQDFGPGHTPGDLVAFQYRGHLAKLASRIARMYVIDWKLGALLVAFLLVRRAIEAQWNLLDYLGIAMLLWPPFEALWNSRVSFRYHRMLTTVEWAKWPQVLKLLPTIRHLLPPIAAARYEAKALAGSGRLDEALAVLRPLSHDRRIAAATLWAARSSVYWTAGEYDQAIEAQEKALQCAPGDPVLLIDLANDLLVRGRETARACQLVEQAAGQVMSDKLHAYLTKAEGIVAIEEGDALLAIERLEDAQRRLKRFRNPVSAATVDVIDGWLALAKAMSGDQAAAQRHFRSAEPRLRAKKMDKLLARCQAALDGTELGRLASQAPFSPGTPGEKGLGMRGAGGQCRQR
jgi:tetratricopeptide (TPR) repeat protein